MFCMKCGQEVSDGSKFCPHCGANIDFGRGPVSVKGAATRAVDGVFNRVTEMYGTQEKVDLKFSDFFSEVGKHHTHEQAEEIFVCGTSKTTPDIREAGRTWAKPWVYSRVLLVLLLTFLGLMLMTSTFQNTNAVPGFIVIGSFMVPVATMFFFFEANAPRDISLFDTLKMFLLGGVGSLIVTLLISEFVPGSGFYELVPAMLTGLIEELAKLALVAYFMRRRKGRNYILGGLLIGSAIGAGFAAFESAGYAFNAYLDPWIEYWSQGVPLQSNGVSATLNSLSFDACLNIIILRGMLAVGGHVAWAAVEGAGIAIVSEGEGFEWEDLIKKEFLALFAFPVICHGIWDWMPLVKYLGLECADVVVLIAAIWILLIVLMRRGIAEVNHAADADDSAMPQESSEQA